MELCPKEKCTGCLACYNVCPHKAIDLSTDIEGFVYPVVSKELCVECGLCSKTCPIIDDDRELYGKPIATYAAWNMNRKLVRKSTSGGLFTSIAEWFISIGGVVYGAAFDEDFRVKHIRVGNNSDLEKLRGSKYVQSYVGDIYSIVKKDLENGLVVLFCGTPCQVSGLRKYIEKNVGKNLYTIDLVCHAVPSPLMFEEYKSYLERKYSSKLVSYRFRDKKWSWLHYNIKAEFENNKVYIGTWEEDVYLRGFLRDFYVRPSCHSCQFAKTERCGDFTLADFWGFRRLKNEKNNFDRGVSLVLVNTTKAESIIHQINHSLYIYPRNIEDAIPGNDALVKPTAAAALRDSFWKDYRDSGYDGLIKKYLYPEPISKSLNRLYKFGRTISDILTILQRGKHKITKIIRS